MSHGTPMKLLLNIYIKYIHKLLLSFVQCFPSYLFFFNNTWNLITSYSLLCIELPTEIILVHIHLCFINCWRPLYNFISCEFISKWYNLLICSTDWRQSFRTNGQMNFLTANKGHFLPLFSGTYLVSGTCRVWWYFLSWKKEYTSNNINYT